ncbi:hypothetical protein [Winogradskyella flava]|uniref:hypothetical protein n=1 Tax=Winogradskyella flava TaxID=1884876 RepID=UPI0024924974|nr:hypothetical protein [Winogradskyella flava]
MKKIKILYLLIVVCTDCGQNNTSNNKTDEKLEKDSLTALVKPEVNGEFAIYEHDLSMYNEKYLMRITPSVDSINSKYESYILLTKKTDTIFNKRINIDSLGQTIIKHKIFADSTEHSKITTDYELRRIVYHGVRTNNLYFEADISSTVGTKDLKVLFQLSYLYKGEIGKLFVNGFSKKGWENNTGEIDNKKNRIIINP